MNLDQFVNRKVTVRFRNGFTATGTLFRSPYAKDYPYIFENNFYTRRGEILIDKLSKYDIVSIQPTVVSIQTTEEPKMTEPNYEEIAAEFYDAFNQTFGNKTERQIAILKKYEKFHKPKLTYVNYIAVDKFVYDGKDYALIDGFWYRVQKCVLTLVEDNNLKSELIDAYYEWEKTR
jgi:hypothetical protein